MNVRGKFRLVSAKVEFLKKELEISKDILEMAKSEFSKEFMTKVIIVDDEDQEQKEEESSTTEEKERVTRNDLSKHRRRAKKEANNSDIQEHIKEDKDDDLKRVFKQIAKRTHPDILLDKSEFERDNKEKMFMKAKQAIEEDDFLELSEIAKSLGIEPPEPNMKHVKMLERTMDRIQRGISRIKSMIAWVWYHEDNPLMREEIMNKYIQRIKN
jgi:hypothetical protein